MTHMTQWYVAQTHANAEFKAAGHLLRQGFSVYLPKYMKLRCHARRKEWVPRPLFPRYLFVGTGPENGRWRAIQSTVGISQLVGFGDYPVHVPRDVIDGLQAREDERGMVAMKAEARFKKGQAVKFVTGALSEQIGLFDCIDDKERVVILLDLLGRQIRVQAPIENVQAYA
jgi:transcriptional antiterminator RfaH